jgi:glutaredoxin-related protein/uncharacterized membrane protein
VKTHRTPEILFLALACAGILLCGTELWLQLHGQSICGSAGCELVAEQARFGEISILVLGLALFALLAGAAAFSWFRTSPVADQVISTVLIVSLASEGFLAGYQAFAIRAPCYFCLTVFALLVVLALLRFCAGRPEVAYGFAAMVAVLSFQYLIMPARPALALPSERLILFYSDACPHCVEIRKEFEERKIVAAHVPVAQYAALLKELGVAGIPTLLVNDSSRKVFLTGTDAIRQFLFPPAPVTTSEKAPEKRTSKTGPRRTSPGNRVTPSEPAPGLLDLTAPPVLLGPEGICVPSAEPCP